MDSVVFGTFIKHSKSSHALLPYLVCVELWLVVWLSMSALIGSLRQRNNNNIAVSIFRLDVCFIRLIWYCRSSGHRKTVFIGYKQFFLFVVCVSGLFGLILCFKKTVMIGSQNNVFLFIVCSVDCYDWFSLFFCLFQQTVLIGCLFQRTVLIGCLFQRTALIGFLFQRTALIGPLFWRTVLIGPLFQLTVLIDPLFQQTALNGPLFQWTALIDPLFQRTALISCLFQRTALIGCLFQRTALIGCLF